LNPNTTLTVSSGGTSSPGFIGVFSSSSGSSTPSTSSASSSSSLEESDSREYFQ
jgi:hypothetical protein